MVGSLSIGSADGCWKMERRFGTLRFTRRVPDLGSDLTVGKNVGAACVDWVAWDREIGRDLEQAPKIFCSTVRVRVVGRAVVAGSKCSL